MRGGGNANLKRELSDFIDLLREKVANAASFGNTYALTDSAVTGNSVNEMRYRLYVKRSVGTGNMIIYRMLSSTAY